MNTLVIGFVAAVAVLSQSTSAQCIPTCSNYVASPLLLPAPVLSPIVSTSVVSTPIISPIVSTPIVPTTTIVQTRNSVTDSLVDILQMLPITSLLSEQLPYGPNLCLPVASPVFSTPIVSTCGCGPLITNCGCGPVIF